MPNKTSLLQNHFSAHRSRWGAWLAKVVNVQKLEWAWNTDTSPLALGLRGCHKDFTAIGGVKRVK
jgi:hypothetical protein